MKYIFFLSSFLGQIIVLQAQLVWTAKKDFGGGNRQGAISFVLKGKAYVGTGLKGKTHYQDLWEYDPATDAWTQKADVPGLPRKEASAFVVGEYGYVGLGWNAVGSTTRWCPDIYSYNADSNTWTKMADFPDNRYSATGFGIGSNGYITCGIVNGLPRKKDLWEYNPSLNKWTQRASLPSEAMPRSYPVCATDDSFCYLMGGFHDYVYENDFYRYDPLKNDWISLPDFPGKKRSNAVGFRLGNHIFAGSGHSHAGRFRDWYYYHTDSAKWTQIDSHPSSASYFMCAFAIGTKGYTVGGRDQVTTRESRATYCFDATALLGMNPMLNDAPKFGVCQIRRTNSIKVKRNIGFAEITVYTSLGQLVCERKQYQLRQGDMVDLQLKSAGIYFVRLCGNNLQACLKINYSAPVPK